MLAVLEDAIWSYITYPSKRDPHFFEVEDWFWQENSNWLFSFENICDVLNLSPQRIRQGLLRHKSQQPTERFQMVLSKRLKTMKRHRSLSHLFGLTKPTPDRAIILVYPEEPPAPHLKARQRQPRRRLDVALVIRCERTLACSHRGHRNERVYVPQNSRDIQYHLRSPLTMKAETKGEAGDRRA
jgi:hypothetical protein